MEFHKSNAKLTIATRRIEKNPSMVFKINKNKTVKDIIEKPVDYDFINANFTLQTHQY